MVRISKSPEERKEELVEAAQALFLEKGYLRTKVSDIVRHIKVSQGIFYYYFPSKDAVVEEIVNRYMQQHLSQARSVLAMSELGPLEKLEEMARRQLEINLKENNNIHAIKGVDIHERILNRLIVDYVPLMVQAFDGGADETVKLKFEVFVSAGNVLMDPGLFSWPPVERNRKIDGLITMMEESLGQVPGAFSFYRGLMGYV